MIERTRFLGEDERIELDALMEACLLHDGAASTIQFCQDLNADGEADSWFLLREDGRLAAACSVFAPWKGEAELSLCVRPDARGRGFASLLLNEAAGYLRGRGTERLFLVCDRASADGRRFAERRASGLDHSEHTLLRTGWSVPECEARLDIRPAGGADAAAVAGLLAAAFGDDEADAAAFVEKSLRATGRELFVGFYVGELVCVCAPAREASGLSINTVAVHPSFRRRGFARELLSRVLSLRVGADEQVAIDVDGENEGARLLYEALGFRMAKTVDYHLV